MDRQAEICIVGDMPTDDQVKDLARRITPHLQECGVEVLTVCAIVTDGDGKPARVSFTAAPSRNTDPKFLAMLMSIDRLGTCWSKGEL